MSEEYEGYSNEIDYTFGYYPLLSPPHLRLACLNQSTSFPSNRPFRYLELGHGNGVSLNIHAAACPGEYWGIDINPSHVNFSEKLAEAADTGVRVLNLSFSDLLNYPSLPNFDLVVIYGVWSYISAANRNAITDLLRQKLAEGGLFYVSYNCLPGSSSIVPLQYLLRLYSERGGCQGTVVDRLQAGIAFANELWHAGSEFFASIPKASERLEQIKSEDPAYLVHEYLHEFWHVPSFAETARSLSDAGLRFLASAYLLDHYEDLNICQEGMALLTASEDPLLRETARDFLRNKQFRQDIFVKGKASGPGPERKRDIENTSIMLGISQVEIPSKIKTKVGSISLLGPPFSDVVSALARDGYRSKTVGEVIERCRHQLSAAEVTRAIVILIGVGIVYPVQDDAIVARAAAGCRRLNEEILRHTRSGTRLTALASPVTGCGIQMSRLQQLFLIAYQAGAKTSDEWARFAWESSAPPIRLDPAARGSGYSKARILRESLLFQVSLPVYSALGLAGKNNS